MVIHQVDTDLKSVVLTGARNVGWLEPLANTQKGAARARIAFSSLQVRGAMGLPCKNIDSLARSAMLTNDFVNGGIFSRYADLRLAHAAS